MENTYRQQEPVTHRTNARQLEGIKGMQMPAVPVLQDLTSPVDQPTSSSPIQRKIGDAGDAAKGRKVRKTNAKVANYKVLDVRRKDEKWEYLLTMTPKFSEDIWVSEDDAYDLAEEVVKKKELKANQVAVDKSAIPTSSGAIGGTKYSITMDGGRIQLAHTDLKDLKAFIEFKIEESEAEKTAAVSNMDCKPYNSNGLGTILIEAFMNFCRNNNITRLTLGTQNTAPGFWSIFGLAQNQYTAVTDGRLQLPGPFVVTDPAVEQEKYNHL